MKRFLCWLIATAALGLGATAAPMPLPTLAGLPLVLVLPGYALSLVAFPKARASERVQLSVGLSLPLAALSGYILNLTPWGITPAPIVVLLASITVIAIGFAPDSPVPTRRFPITRQYAATLAACAVLLVTAIAVARIGVETQPRPGFTQLWLFHNEVGVANDESTATTYDLRLSSADGSTVAEWPHLTLEPGQQFQTRASPDVTAADLYLGRAPDSIYRHVALAGAQ